MEELLKRLKGSPVIVAAAVVVLVAAVLIIIFFTEKCYAVEVDNKVVAIVKDKQVVEDILESILNSNKKTLGMEVQTPNKITYKEVSALGKKITPSDEIKQELQKDISITVEAFAINVNGKEVALLRDNQTAEGVLARIKDSYLKQSKGDTADKISFLEDVRIIKKIAKPEDIQDADTVYKNVTAGVESVKKYIVVSGDTVSEIAEKFGMKLAEIKKLNPDMDIDKIQIGQELSLNVPKYLINIKVVETSTYEKAIPFEVKYEESGELYKGQAKVKIAGKEGKKEVTAELIKINGVPSEEKVVAEKVIEEPKEQVELKGTKERPKTLAYGEFYNPSRGSLTSRFGSRWGKQHTGIDIGIPSGSSVKASDGGKVTFAGWKGNYGKLVIIDHENGYVTYYGHCSSLKVKAGQRVYRGQVIALSGATGNVTGPHLHFEVRKNGVPVNPLKYVDY